MSEARRLEALAERLRAVEPEDPSPAAKIRGWNLTLASVQQSWTAHRPGAPVGRLALAIVAVIVLLLVGAIAASADSLPDSPLYPFKGAVEQARGLLVFGPSDKLTYRLELAQTRLREAAAMITRHRSDLASKALAGMNAELDDAAQLVISEKKSDMLLAADMNNRLQQAIAVHDGQLAGLQGQTTNPKAQSEIATARERADQAGQHANDATTQPDGRSSKSGRASSSAADNGSASANHGGRSAMQSPEK